MLSQEECALSQPPKSSLGPGEPQAREPPYVATSLLASIVESSDDGIYSLDLDGIITSWNKGAEELFGYTAAEAVGKPLVMLIPLDRQDEEIAILERIRRGERIRHYETVRRRKDGSLVEISLTVSPIGTPEGNIIGVVKDRSGHFRPQEKRAIDLSRTDPSNAKLVCSISGHCRARR
jgi:PAS domain S-box-containing protein